MLQYNIDILLFKKLKLFIINEKNKNKYTNICLWWNNSLYLMRIAYYTF